MQNSQLSFSRAVACNSSELNFTDYKIQGVIQQHEHELRVTRMNKLEMWANAQRDGRPAKYRWRPLFNAAKFG